MGRSNGAYFGTRRRLRRNFDQKSNRVWGRMFFAFITIPVLFLLCLILQIGGLGFIIAVPLWFVLWYPRKQAKRSHRLRNKQ